MDIKETAVKYHNSGFNCAQSVLATLRDYTGLDEATSLAIAGGLGAGFRCGEICGAASGGVIAISLSKPYNKEGDTDAKDRIAELTKKFTAAFKAECGNIRCEDIRGKGRTCNDFIVIAAELAKTVIENN